MLKEIMLVPYEEIVKHWQVEVIKYKNVKHQVTILNELNYFLILYVWFKIFKLKTLF